jgi:hypothetical protein
MHQGDISLHHPPGHRLKSKLRYFEIPTSLQAVIQPLILGSVHNRSSPDQLKPQQSSTDLTLLLSPHKLARLYLHIWLNHQYRTNPPKNDSNYLIMDLDVLRRSRSQQWRVSNRRKLGAWSLIFSKRVRRVVGRRLRRRD